MSILKQLKEKLMRTSTKVSIINNSLELTNKQKSNNKPWIILKLPISQPSTKKHPISTSFWKATINDANLASKGIGRPEP